MKITIEVTRAEIKKLEWFLAQAKPFYVAGLKDRIIARVLEAARVQQAVEDSEGCYGPSPLWPVMKMVAFHIAVQQALRRDER